MKFFSAMALVADQEDRGVAMAGMAAGDIGVQALDLVGEAGLLKEVERAIDCRRLCGAFAIEVSQQVIGLGRFCAFQQQAQDLTADFRHPLALARDQGFGFVQEGVHILRAAGRVRVKVCVAVCGTHAGNVVCFVHNVKGQGLPFWRVKGWTESANHLRFLRKTKIQGDERDAIVGARRP